MTGSGHFMHVYSRKFAALLERVSGVRLEWRQVLPKHKKDWVELIGGPSVNEVTPRNMKVSGWRCSRCQIVRILARVGAEGIRHFIQASKLPAPVPGVFAINSGRGIALGMRDEVWSALRARPEAKGLSSQVLGVVADEEISDLARFVSYESYQADPHAVLS
jgi:hypothetical protein